MPQWILGPERRCASPDSYYTELRRPVSPRRPDEPGRFDNPPASMDGRDRPPIPHHQPGHRVTNSSYYSLSDLPDEDSRRYLRGSEVRRQVADAPDERPMTPRGPRRRDKPVESKYPKNFRNDENVNVKTKKPHNEFPLTPSGSYVPAYRDFNAGPARAIYNVRDRMDFDVVYHNNKISNNNYDNMDLSKYRPAAYKGPQVLEPSRRNRTY